MTPLRDGAVGILGGTFDPPHVGHLVIAEDAREALGIDRVLFLPAGDPWQKSDRGVTPRHIRRLMVERAIDGNPSFVLDSSEIDRPGPSYTVDTLAALAGRTVAVDPWFILSSEALAGLATWREPERILSLARLCVVPRGAAPGAAVAAFHERYPGNETRVAVLDRPRLAISSTDVRARVRAGRSIRYLVPDGVAELIREYALYAAHPAPAPQPASVPADA